jgi:hypothetical protein
MDLITALPKTRSGHDAIVVFVCRLTKMKHYVPALTTVTALKLAALFVREVVRLHGVPERILSDRDPRFTAHFWKELWRLLGTLLTMSTAYHPQTNGQTERENRTLEEMLRGFTNWSQNDWDEHLPALELAAAEVHDHGLQFDDLSPDTPMPELEPDATSNKPFPFTPEQRQELLNDGISDELLERLEQGGEGQKDSGGLYTSQIDAMMTPYRPNYLGCIARDQAKLIAKKINKQRQFCFIENTDLSNQKGTHWTCWYFDRDAKTIEFYNSLADPITQDLMDSIKPITDRLHKLDHSDVLHAFRATLYGQWKRCHLG